MRPSGWQTRWNPRGHFCRMQRLMRAPKIPLALRKILRPYRVRRLRGCCFCVDINLGVCRRQTWDLKDTFRCRRHRLSDRSQPYFSCRMSQDTHSGMKFAEAKRFTLLNVCAIEGRWQSVESSPEGTDKDMWICSHVLFTGFNAMQNGIEVMYLITLF